MGFINKSDLTQVSEFIDIHKNKKAIICGCGKSLNKIDLDKIKNKIIFACNQSVSSLKYCDYFCTTDAAIVENKSLFEYGSRIANKIIAMGNLGQIYKLPYYNEIKDKVYFVQRTNETTKFNKQSLIIKTDVIQPTTNLAYVMGCTPIILAGVDLYFSDKTKSYCDNLYLDKEIIWNQAIVKNIVKTKLNGQDVFTRPPYLKALGHWKKIKNDNKIDLYIANKDSLLSDIFDVIETLYE